MFVQKLAIAFLSAFCACVLLWSQSDPPPYGEPYNELSNNYWGFIVDIGHKWRTMNFSFWDPGIGAGSSLFTCGQYPLLNPTNAMAWMLNDEQFYLFKLIEPYFIGIFFTILLLLDIFGMPWFIGIFGGLMYMGLPVARQTPLSQSPIFLFGCAAFPCIIYFFLRFLPRSFFLACALMGGGVAYQFCGTGVTQLPQMVIWFSLLLIIYGSLTITGGGRFKIFGSLWGLVIFGVMAVGVCALQFIPTAIFTIFDSSRMPGHYQINNFPFEYRPYADAGNRYLLGILKHAFILSDSSASMRGITAVLLAVVAMAIAHFNAIKNIFCLRGHLGKIWLAMLSYLFLPYVLELITVLFPPLLKKLSIFTTFTFYYGVHTLDFCLALTVCHVLQKGEAIGDALRRDPFKRTVALFLFVIAMVFYLLPFLAHCWSSLMDVWVKEMPVLSRFIPNNFPAMLANTVVTTFILAGLWWGYKRAFLRFLFCMSLIMLGMMLTVGCFGWNNKGRQSHLGLYKMDAPEYVYYRQSKGKFFLPYDFPYNMIYNYNLLYGVHGASGFVAIPPYRISKFMTTYHSKQFYQYVDWVPTIYTIQTPSCDLFQYFPADFITIDHQKSFLCPEFTKAVDGQDWDIWQRDRPTEQILFGHGLKVVHYDEIIRKFDQPFDGNILVEEKDAVQFGIKEHSEEAPVSDQNKYTLLNNQRADTLVFNITIQQPSFVLIKNMFQSGWQLYVDRHSHKIFPAQYLFLGFELPAGEHRVELIYRPPGLFAGMVMNIVCWLVLWIWIIRMRLK